MAEVAAFADGEVRTGTVYEAERASSRAALASSAPLRRVRIGDLVLVFQTRETVRAALEEVLRAERIVDEARIAHETAAFAALLPGPDELAAALFVDVSDPLELADRVAQLTGLPAAVSLELAGRPVPARPDGEDDGSGVHHLLFGLGRDGREAILAGAEVAVVVDHPHCRGRTAMTADQVTTVAADLRG